MEEGREEEGKRGGGGNPIPLHTFWVMLTWSRPSPPPSWSKATPTLATKSLMVWQRMCAELRTSLCSSDSMMRVKWDATESSYAEMVGARWETFMTPPGDGVRGKTSRAPPPLPPPRPAPSSWYSMMLHRSRSFELAHSYFSRTWARGVSASHDEPQPRRQKKVQRSDGFKSINQSIEKSIEQSINQSKNSINRSINQSIDESSNQSTNENVENSFPFFSKLLKINNPELHHFSSLKRSQLNAWSSGATGEVIVRFFRLSHSGKISHLAPRAKSFPVPRGSMPTWHCQKGKMKEKHD